MAQLSFIVIDGLIDWLIDLLIDWFIDWSFIGWTQLNDERQTCS